MAGLTIEKIVSKRIDDLPVIVDVPGNYRTRDGRLVVVHNITDIGIFRVNGTLYTPPKPKKVRTKVDYDIWHVSGRAMVLSEMSYDIVSKDGG